MQDLEYVKSKVRDILDFPQKGIVFKDLTTAFKDPQAMAIMGRELSAMFADKGVTKVVGIESRGFIVGAVMAYELGAGFVPIRKPGKLPADTIKATYDKEYGTDTIEIHSDAITPDDIVVIHDDVLATGGTMAAAYNLVKSMNPKKAVPLIEIHGTADKTSMWEGDPANKGGWGEYISVPLAVGVWSAEAKCTHTESTELPQKGDNKVIMHRHLGGVPAWKDGPEVEVRLYEIIGGKHSWGLKDMDTCEEIWQFFSKYLR